jgi:hypothetical protein
MVKLTGWLSTFPHGTLAGFPTPSAPVMTQKEVDYED